MRVNLSVTAVPVVGITVRLPPVGTELAVTGNTCEATISGVDLYHALSWNK